MHDKPGKSGGAWDSLGKLGETWRGGGLGMPGEAWGSLEKPGEACTVSTGLVACAKMVSGPALGVSNA